MNEFILEMKDITKEFFSYEILHGVNLQLRKNSVLALCGENGAGKSTLMKILSGTYPFGEYSGNIYVDGVLKQFHSNRDSAEAGIEIIYQELEVIPNMTVAENVFLGREPTVGLVVNMNEMVQKTKTIFEELKIDINPSALVGDLGIGLRQMVVIARALSRNPKVLILDEPSAALTETETQNLLQIVKDLVKTDVACIYISHKLDEVMEIADDVTVIRDGYLISNHKKTAITKDMLIKDMVGRSLDDQFVKEKSVIGDVIFEAKNITSIEESTSKILVNDVSFYLKEGEILGVAGLMGAGRTELVMSLIGAFPGKVIGDIFLEGRKITNDSPRHSIKNGTSIVVEDRKEQGLVLGLDVKANIIMASLEKVSKHGILNTNEIMQYSDRYFSELNIKAKSTEVSVSSLSGGNQQKVVLAKALMTSPKVLILDEPTRGIDVGAKHEIYQIISSLVKTGVSIIMISSELPEIIAMSDRVLVMNTGHLTATFDNKDLSQEDIMRYATMEV